jgi:hypothetical protein
MSIWKTLSTIDVNKFVEKKGQFSYLAWTHAWAVVKENYPDSTYQLEPDTTYPDGTMECRVSVTIPIPDSTGQTLTHTMWLPVLNHSNKPISNPNAFDINSTRMRCLVKCLAMFGLGHYIYAGESTPAPAGLDDATAENLTSAIGKNDLMGFMTMWSLLGDDEKAEYYNSAPQGHKTKFKEQVREIESRFHQMVSDYEDGIKESIASGIVDDLKAHLDELADDPILKQYVWNRLGPVEKQAIKEALA